MDDHPQRFRRLIEPVHDRVLGFARSLCRSTTEGDDLFQEAMLRAFRKLDGLHDDRAFRAWLYRIVITVHRTRCRRTLWRRLLPLGAADDDGDARDTDDRATGWTPEIAEANHRVRQALAALPVAQREAIVLFEIEGWLVEDIAAVQRVSISAVKSRLARGRDQLRAQYDARPTLASSPSPTLIPEDAP